jgi:protein-S-isoprenylcysteine O-methyltransferase Ste14
MNVPETPAPQDHAEVVAMPPLLYFISLVAGVVAKWVFGGAMAPGSTLRVALGVLLMIVGVSGALWFWKIFERTGQDRSPRTPTPEIVTQGPYAYSRNPAYVSLSALQIGLGLLLDNVWILLFLVPVLFVMHYGVILREEAYLERRFGEEYLRYKERVRRWL